MPVSTPMYTLAITLNPAPRSRQMQLISPRRIRSDHHAQSDQQFAHASDDGNLFVFSRIHQASIKCFDNGVKSSGAQRGHVQRCTYARAAAPNQALAATCAAVAAEWTDSHESTDLATVKTAELR